VAPIITVAGPSASSASPNRSSARTWGCSWSAEYAPRYSSWISWNVSGVSSTTTTSAISSRPYILSGERTLSAIRPPTTLPIAIPPKKPVRIAETACVVFPNTSTSWRAQTIS